MDAAPPVIAELTRNGVPESRHRGWVAVARGDGSLVAHVGDPERLTFPRSAMKPFQAVAVVESGAADRFEFTDAELAICCGSHHGEPRHRETVAGILAKIGMPATALLGAIDPPWSAERERLAEAGDEVAQRLAQNCSGKHGGMLAACVAQGYPTGSYDAPDHPHQRAIRAIVARFWDVPEDALVAGLDNCTLPAYAAPIRQVATGWARIADPDSAPAGHRDAIRRVGEAMGRAPFMVAGTEGLNTILMEITGGRVLAKDGAEGVICLAVRDKGLGITVKVEDGSFRAHGVIVRDLLGRLDALAPDEDAALADAVAERLESNRQQHVGDIRSTLDLRFVR